MAQSDQVNVSNLTPGEARKVTRLQEKAAPKPRTEPVKSIQPGPGVFVVFGLVLVIGLVQLVGKGTLSEGVFLAGLVALLIGAILPAVVVPVLVVALIALVLRDQIGTRALSWLGSLASKPAQPSVPIASLNPSEGVK